MSSRKVQTGSRKTSRVARREVLSRAVRPVVASASAGFEPLETRVLMSVAAHYYNDGFWGRGDGNRPSAPSTATPFPEQTISVNRVGDVVTSVNQVAFDWGTGSPHPAIRGDNHSTVFVGKLVAPEEGDYEILGFGDDDTHVFIGGQLVSSDPLGHGIRDPRDPGSIANGGGTAVVTLTAGAHDLIVLQAEQGGGSGVFLRWITPTMAEAGEAAVNVPAANLIPDNAVPDAPTAFARTTTDVDGNPLPATEIAFTFTDNSTEELRYELERSSDGTTFTRLPRVAAINSGRISDFGALAGVNYTYRLVAVNFAGRTPAANTVAATGAASAPAAPTGVTATPTGANTVDVAFTDASLNETGFEILRSRTNNIAGATLVGTAAADATTFTVGGLQPATQYFFFVRAINDAGSAAAPGVAGTTEAPAVLDLTEIPAGPGALARYYNASTPQPLPDGTPVFIRVEETINNHFGGGSPDPSVNADNHSGVYTGMITAPQTGTYRFNTNTDDGAFVYVNGVQVVNDPTYHGPFIRQGDRTIELVAGQAYCYYFKFFEGGGGSDAELRWRLPDGTEQTIPASAYTSNRRGTATTTAAPLNLRATNQTGTQATIVFDNEVSCADTHYFELVDSTGAVVREITTGPDASPLTITGLTANTSYTIRARAFSDETGLSTQSTATFNSGAITSPAAPTVVRVIPRAGATAVTITDQAINEGGFVFERSVNGGAFTEAGRLPASAAGVSGGNFTFTDTATVAGQNVVYRIRAAGADGAADSATVSTTSALIPTAGTGLRERAFDDLDFTGSDAVPDPVVTIQPVIDENFGSNPPQPELGPDQFSIIYDGSFQAEVTGSYRFGLSSDDGVSLLLLDPTTGLPLINFNNLGARRGADFANPQDTVGPVNLVAGTRYPIEVRMVEDGGGAGVKLFQSIEGLAFETVPGATLFPQDPNAAPVFAPLNVRGSSLCNEQITVLFDDANFTETGFEVERATSAAGPFTSAGPALPAGANTFVLDGPFVVGQPVFFRIRGTGANNTFTPYSTPVSITPTDGATETRTDITLNRTARFITGTPTNPANPSDATGQALQLTDNANDQTGTAFLTYARDFDRDFTTNFSFQIPEGNGADGFAFVIQGNTPSAIGGGGGALGYAGIPNSFAIKFDIYNGINQTGVYIGGEAISDNGPDAGFEFDNASVYDVTITYNADGADEDGDGTPDVGTDNDAVTVRIVDRADPENIVYEETYSATVNGAPFDMDTVLGTDGCGFIGFTGATGGLNAEQNILDFSVNGQNIPLVAPTGGTLAAVSQVFVNGPGLTGQTTANGQAFRAAAGVDNVYGYPVPAGTAQTRSIPWVGGVNQVALRFTSDVAATLAQGDLVVRGVNTPTYTVTGFTYDPATRTGVWTLGSAITNDKVRLFLDDALVTGLDGEWTDASAAESYPSGNGTAGGDFAFRFNVLRGDATQDGRVNALDLSFIKQRLNKTATNPGSSGAVYSPFADLTADGAINALDLSAARARLNNALPTAEPASLFSRLPISR